MKKSISMLLLSIAVLLIFFSSPLISYVDHYFPITNIQVEAPFIYVSKQLIETNINEQIEKGLVSIDILSIENALNKLAWVHTAHVKKIWPGTLFIKIIERRPVAQFNDTMLIDELGALFLNDPLHTENLIKLQGAQGSEKELLQEYKKVSRLLNNIALVVTMLEITPSTTTIVMSDGLKLLMSSEEAKKQLARFIHVYPELSQKKTTPMIRVDMRYKHGLAVKW